MEPTEPLTKRKAARVWRGYKETKKIVTQMIASGWSVVPQGKHYRAFCPCTAGDVRDGAADVRISCTPQNDGTHARRLRDAMHKCPDRHQYIH